MQEFDVAFHHNILVKRKKCLVVLMALDSPTDFLASDTSNTATLRQYLRQYTYIDYTADDWLDNLLLVKRMANSAIHPLGVGK